MAGHAEEEAHGRGMGRAYYLSAQRSWADCQLMPTARPMSAQEAPAAFAAATVFSSLWPAFKGDSSDIERQHLITDSGS